MQHQPRKRFGQNFLQSAQVIEAIVRAIDPHSKDRVIEIGPGQGALTQPLLNELDALTAIEIDRDLIAVLKNLPLPHQHFNLIEADALTVDFGALGHNLKIVGNLPYNISTPLMIHLLHFADHIKEMHFMLQKEVVERLVAQPGSKIYGRLSVMIQSYCEAENLFVVPPHVFYPQPKVDSAVVRLTPYHQFPFNEKEFNCLEKVVAQAFSMRRKTLANNLKKLMPREDLIALGIEPSLRPEQISVAEYKQIAKFISK